MKRYVATYLIAMLVSFGLTSSAGAAIEFGQDDWGLTLDANQSITCIAHFVWYGVEFNDIPIQVPEGIYPTHENGGRWDDIGWVAELSPDHKTAYIYGPQVTNTTGTDDLGWFAYTLSYLWDTVDPNYDPNYPIYIDTAIYNGPFGSEPIDSWGLRGTPGDLGSWQYRDIPYATDEPWYTEDFFNNPAPEPSTILIFGLGSVVFFIKRYPRSR